MTRRPRANSSIQDAVRSPPTPLVLAVAKDGRAEDDPKTVPRLAEVSPRCPPREAKAWPEIANRRPQEGSKRPQEGTGRASSGPDCSRIRNTSLARRKLVGPAALGFGGSWGSPGATLGQC